MEVKTVLAVKIKYRCLEFVSWNVKVQLHCLVEGEEGGVAVLAVHPKG